MKYLIILLAVAVVAWFFLFKGEVVVVESKRSAAPVAPEKQFEKVLSASPVEAAGLASLCEAYPQVAAQVLRNKQFRMSGTISDFRLAGMEGRRAEVLLHGGQKRKIVLIFDLDKYARFTVHEPQQGKYAIVDTELFWVPRGGKGKKLLFAKETSIQQLVATQAFGATNISFSALSGKL